MSRHIGRLVLFLREVDNTAVINGEKVDAAGKTFESYLSQAGFDTKRIAVIRNDDIVPKCEYSTCTIDEDDVIEVVSFVGGG